MKWSLDKSENGSIHLIVNGKRAVTRNGQENEVVCVGTGYTSKEMWVSTMNADRTFVSKVLKTMLRIEK